MFLRYKVKKIGCELQVYGLTRKDRTYVLLRKDKERIKGLVEIVGSKKLVSWWVEYCYVSYKAHKKIVKKHKKEQRKNKQ